MNIRSIMQAAAPLMPVLTIKHADDAVPLADALAAGGMRVLEITLRSDAAIEAIRRIRQSNPSLIVGAGTVLNAEQLRAVAEAGGQFAVSPGLSALTANAAREINMPYLPGVVTASEVQQALDLGLQSLKFFPAAQVGGSALLAAYANVYPEVRFCPTGGISDKNMQNYLSLPNVICVGGSWVATSDLMKAKNWAEITRRANTILGSAH